MEAKPPRPTPPLKQSEILTERVNNAYGRPRFKLLPDSASILQSGLSKVTFYFETMILDLLDNDGAR